MAITVTAADKIGHRPKPTGGIPPTSQKQKASLISSIRRACQKAKNTEPNTSQAMVAGAMVIAFAAAGILWASEQSATQGSAKLAARDVINDSGNTLGLVPPAPPPVSSRVQAVSAVTPPDMAPLNMAPADLGPAVSNAMAVSASEKIADLELPI